MKSFKFTDDEIKELFALRDSLKEAVKAFDSRVTKVENKASRQHLKALLNDVKGRIFNISHTLTD